LRRPLSSTVIRIQRPLWHDKNLLKKKNPDLTFFHKAT
jgi:hypothetical protein